MKRLPLTVLPLFLLGSCTDSTGPNTVPTLLIPEEGAVLDNGCLGATDLVEWFFDWSDVQGASAYHLYVIGSTASIPVIDLEITASEYNSSQYAFILDRNRIGWTWKVRARIKGRWTDWTATRIFDAEPLNTDCPVPG